ncbi:hypothetical protein ONS96_014412 [Cadophora gregata f. sp. sojae]|nr:hypothetical protein ONS96_014412 [Cadophora gregata f. sp. sojae]
MKIISLSRFWRRNPQTTPTSSSSPPLPKQIIPPERQAITTAVILKSTKPERENKYGLLPLHIPNPTITPPSDRQYPVDIIAIHGITGGAYSTWTDKISSYFWLQDSLPGEFPGARIYSFGYRANVVFSLETGDFESFARDLLEEIHGTRLSKEEQRRPLIFICHSMGGIVVKKALNVCQIERRYKHILLAVPSILFLSTPHGRSNPADLLAVIAQVATIPLASRWMGRTRHELISALGRNSKDLYSISKEFRHHAKSLKIFSFIEQTSTRPLRELS